MALSRKQLHKKKAKKTAKDKARRMQRNKVSFLSGLAHQASVFKALNYPIDACWETVSLFDSGMGYVVATRRASPHSDTVLVGNFLVDTYCLGIKDAFIRTMSSSDYQSMIEDMQHQSQLGGLQRCHPGYAKKLLAGAAKYAKQYGLPPHKDYAKTYKIFHDVDAEACAESFTYGREGKPFYIAGPNDDAAKQKKIMAQLTRTAGEGNFHFMLPIETFND
jgi:hypothetical protein